MDTDWMALLGPGSDVRAHADLLRIHATYVMPRFAAATRFARLFPTQNARRDASSAFLRRIASA
jgi:hypothetical protein